MRTVNVHDAKTNLSELIALAEAGEEVVIARRGVPVARLVGLTPAIRRVAGEWRRLPGWHSYVFDPSVMAPLTDEQMAEEGWLR